MTVTIEIPLPDTSAGNVSTSETTIVASSTTQLNNNGPTSPISINLTSLTSQTCDTVPTTTSPRSSATIIKKETSTKSATGKSEPSSSKTPRSSSVTGFYAKTFRLRTWCGILELNCLKLTSLVALLISAYAFASLIVVIAINYSLENKYHKELESLDTSGTYYRELMKLSCRAAVTSQYNRTVSLEHVELYRVYLSRYYEVMNNLVKYVPPDVLYWNKHNMTVKEVKTMKAINIEGTMISSVSGGNYSAALVELDSEYYKELLTGHKEEAQALIDYVSNLKHSSESKDLATTTIALIIICLSIAIVVPVLIVYVCLSLKKDNSKEKQLRLVKKYMIMDTMNDATIAERFKDFCKQERSEENFILLEKINEYKKLCERSFDIQVFLFDTDVLSTSDHVSESTSSSNEDSKKKNKGKKGYTEKDLHDIEKKKFEVAFEIYSEFLDVRGDHSVNINKQIADSVKQHLDFFAKGENESMPETLFESIEYEMCILMMDTHHRFKQFLEVQLKERKKILSKLKKTKK